MTLYYSDLDTDDFILCQVNSDDDDGNYGHLSQLLQCSAQLLLSYSLSAVTRSNTLQRCAVVRCADFVFTNQPEYSVTNKQDGQPKLTRADRLASMTDCCMAELGLRIENEQSAHLTIAERCATTN